MRCSKCHGLTRCRAITSPDNLARGLGSNAGEILRRVCLTEKIVVSMVSVLDGNLFYAVEKDEGDEKC